MTVRPWRFARTGPPLLLFALSRAASAQQVHSTSAADALFKEGRQAAKKGDYTTACALFQKSYSFDPAPGTLMNIADCEERQGHLIDALRHFKVTAESLAPGDERIAIAVSRAASLDERLPHLVVRIVQGKYDVRVMVQGEGGGQVGREMFDKPIPVAPGQYTVTLFDGPYHREQAVTFVERETKDVSFNAEAIEREEAKEALAEHEAIEQRQRQAQAQVEAQIQASQVAARAQMKDAMDQAARVQKDVQQRVNAGMALGGGLGFGLPGLGFLTAGFITGAGVLSAKATVAEHCNGSYCDEEGMDAARTGSKLSIAAPVCFAIGVPLTALGVYFLIKGFSSTTALSVQPLRGGPSAVVTHTF